MGPFLGRFLIQRLVTSNPSPAYVARVTDAFNGDGPYGSERGDMKAVIKAILLDEEARSCSAASDDTYGKLREPFIRYMQLSQAFDYQTPSGEFRNTLYSVMMQVDQRPLSSPSVFNFFQSDYAPIGAIEDEGLVAPEFQIASTQTIAGYMNGLNDWLLRERYVNAWSLYEGEPSFDDQVGQFDFADEILLVEASRYDQLLERLNLILAHGKLTQRTLDILVDLVSNIDLDEPKEVVQFAIYMVMSCPEYLINR